MTCLESRLEDHVCSALVAGNLTAGPVTALTDTTLIEAAL